VAPGKHAVCQQPCRCAKCSIRICRSPARFLQRQRCRSVLGTAGHVAREDGAGGVRPTETACMP
jgi:hypothetical protein